MKSRCGHQCAKFCSALEESIRRESQTVEEYHRIAAECDLPEVRLFFRRLIVEREASLVALRRKLDELQLGNDVTDQLNTSYA